MVICRFYKEGRCKFGENCHFEHIDEPRGNSGGNSGGGRGGGDSGSNGFGGRNTSDPFAPRPQHNTRQGDPDDARPIWPLSAVAQPDPSRGNLITEELSPEELRVEAYRTAPRGRSAEIAAREAALLASQQQREAAAGLGQPGDPFAPNGAPAPVAYQASQYEMDMQEPVHANDPFDAPAPSADPFAGGGSFSAAQQPAPYAAQTAFAAPQAAFVAPTPAPAQATLSTQDNAQFSAASFGFENVPETAPPPRFC